jgi:hypothetical protein
MTLQERMVAVYLRQAKLPPEEKDKLRLFLGLLLTTFDEEEEREKEIREEGTSSVTAVAVPPSPRGEGLAVRFEGEGTAVRSLDCARDDKEIRAGDDNEQSKEEVADPLAGALIEALDRLGMSPESPEAEKYFGIRRSVLQKLLKGENIRHDSRARILQRVQDAGIAATADDAQV